MDAVSEKWLADEIKLAEDGAEKSEYERLLALAMRELRDLRAERDVLVKEKLEWLDQQNEYAKGRAELAASRDKP